MLHGIALGFGIAIGVWLFWNIPTILYVLRSLFTKTKPLELTSHQRFVMSELDRMEKGLPDPDADFTDRPVL